MILGIDASNIRAGGGLTHLIGLLSEVDPREFGFEKVIVWGGKQVYKLPDQPWLIKQNLDILNKPLPFRVYWQKFKLSKLAKKYCDVLFVPAGNYNGSFKPFVSMSQNMLVFENKERNRYGLSLMSLRLLLLKRIQLRSFKKATSIILLSQYAKNYISKYINLGSKHVIIHHGISEDFRKKPSAQQNIEEFSSATPFKILYVSIIDMYKHQNTLVKAIDKLYKENIPVELTLVGPFYTPALNKLNKTLSNIKNASAFIKIKGKIAFEEVSSYYKNTNAFVFCSSCENMPNIVIEAMSAGLPIASSNYGPMPEFLKDAAFYFDPLSVESTYKALKELIQNTEERAKKAERSYLYSQEYSWNKCARETFSHLYKIALNNK